MNRLNVKYIIILLLTLPLYWSCEHTSTINEDDISQPVNEVLSILFCDKSVQKWNDTIIDYREYFEENFDLKKALFYKQSKIDSLSSKQGGTVLCITGIYTNTENDTKTSKQIVILKNIKLQSGIEVNGQFSRQFLGFKGDYESLSFNGFIELSNQPGEPLYFKNINHWSDGGISGIIEIKGKGKLIFERTGNTLFFDKHGIFK